MATILRESSAGQIGRLYLGLKIAPYLDEREGFVLPQHATEEQAVAPNSQSEPQPEGDPEKEGSEDGSDRLSNRDIEKDVVAEPQQPSAKPDAKPDPNIVDWYGPNDEENPQNWSTAKKAFAFAQICLLTFSSTLF